MRKLIMVLLFACVGAFGQSISTSNLSAPPLTDYVSASQSITASGTTHAVCQALSGYQSVSAEISGTFNATIAAAQESADAATINAAAFYNIQTGAVIGTYTQNATATSNYEIIVAGGTSNACVYASVYTSGTINVVFRLSNGPRNNALLSANGSNLVGLLAGYYTSPNQALSVVNVGVDPCASSGVAKSHKFANITTATTTQIIAVSGSTNIYVCGINFQLNSSTSSTIYFEHGTSTNCTGTTADTATYANSTVVSEAISLGFGGHTFYATGASQGLCAVTTVGTSPTVAVDITFVQQ